VSDRPSLSGHTALVTGASRGIGARVAETLAEAGARVWLMARSAALIREHAERLGGSALAVDLTDEVAVWAALDELQEELGG